MNFKLEIRLCAEKRAGATGEPREKKMWSMGSGIYGKQNRGENVMSMCTNHRSYSTHYAASERHAWQTRPAQ